MYAGDTEMLWEVNLCCQLKISTNCYCGACGNDLMPFHKETNKLNQTKPMKLN